MNNIIVQNRKDQFAEVVSMIQHTRNEVVRLANASLIDLYWRVGKYISNKISISEWGDGVVKQLADYIERNSPEVKGFSDKNLWRMKQFYETYKDADEKLSPVVRQISWTNNLTIMSRSKSVEDLLEHRTDGTDAFDTLFIGAEKFPQTETSFVSVSGVS